MVGPRVMAAVLVVLALAAVAAGGSIALRERAEVDAGAPVRLGDVAVLAGPEAEALSGLILPASGVGAAGEGWHEIEVRQVRAALLAAGAPMGRLVVSGGRCTVRLRGAGGASGDADEPASAEIGPDRAGARTGSVRARVIDALSALLSVKVEDLRLSFDPRDAGLLDQPVGTRRVVVEPASTLGSLRAVLDVRVFEGDRLVESRAVRVDVLVRRRAVVLREEVRKGQEVGASMVEEREGWFAPEAGAPIGTAGEVEGLAARSRLAAGVVLKREHLEAAVLVRRNELTTVHCLSGGIAVKARARARSDGRRGDVIEFRMEGSSRSFWARVDGAGLAIKSDRSSGGSAGVEP